MILKYKPREAMKNAGRHELNVPGQDDPVVFKKEDAWEAVVPNAYATVLLRNRSKSYFFVGDEQIEPEEVKPIEKKKNTPVKKNDKKTDKKTAGKNS